jgi:hypothetical protein
MLLSVWQRGGTLCLHEVCTRRRRYRMCARTAYTRSAYSRQHEPALYGANVRFHQWSPMDSSWPTASDQCRGRARGGQVIYVSQLAMCSPHWRTHIGVSMATHTPLLGFALEQLHSSKGLDKQLLSEQAAHRHGFCASNQPTSRHSSVGTMRQTLTNSANSDGWHHRFSNTWHLSLGSCDMLSAVGGAPTLG